VRPVANQMRVKASSVPKQLYLECIRRLYRTRTVACRRQWVLCLPALVPPMFMYCYVLPLDALQYLVVGRAFGAYLGLGFDSNSATFFEFRKFDYLNYSNFELKSNFHVLHVRCVHLFNTTYD